MDQPAFTPPFTPIDEDQRRGLRTVLTMQAKLRDRGQTRFSIHVIDLSLTGFRAEISFTLWPGTIVWLTMPGLAALEAVVAWRGKLQYGCAFATPLHPVVVDHIANAGQR